jgi:hypothetical protein
MKILGPTFIGVVLLFIILVAICAPKDTSTPPSPTPAVTHYIQMAPEEAAQLDDRTVINVNSMMRVGGCDDLAGEAIIIKYVTYRQARPFHSRFNMGAWAVDVQNASRYLGWNTTAIQNLEDIWERSGCQ